jgi:hypothetical protein
MRRALPGIALLVVGALACGVMLFARLSHPLLWQDEGETVMFATRVLAYGYPRVHGERNVVNEFGAHAAAGVKEGPDAYIGKTWADFYLAAPAVRWAAGHSDPYAKTWRLRLPFAIAGALGLALFVWSVHPALGGGPRRALRFEGLFFLLCAVSISLLLHLREVRYYALLVLLTAGVIAVHLRYAVFGTLRFAPYAALQACLLLALFHVFHPAWIAATAVFGLERGVSAWRAVEPGPMRARRMARELLPFALAAVLVAPFLLFFETFQVAARFAANVGLSAQVYLENLATVSQHLLRHELLAPALVTRAAVVVLAAGDRHRIRAETSAARRTAALLGAFGLGYTLVVCLNPLIYERYFVVLSPVVTLVFLLDSSTLIRVLPRRALPLRRRALRAALVAALVALVSVTLLLRADAIRGRLAEIREPVRGPLDFVVPHLLERYPDPRELVIATNYEAHPLMYYLDSRVIVGLSLNNIARERALEPDVVIPRRGWPRGLVELRRFLARGRYAEESLPVRDTLFNNIPSLSRTPTTPEVHRFHTPVADPGAPGSLRVHHRERPPE